jgi:hypothetical protein
VCGSATAAGHAHIINTDSSREIGGCPLAGDGPIGRPRLAQQRKFLGGIQDCRSTIGAVECGAV